MSGNFAQDQRVVELCALESLKRLKARYCYGIDHKDWQMWRNEVFTPDASLCVQSLEVTVTGIEPIIGWVKERWIDILSVHHAHMPDLEILSSTTARGRWAMEDRLFRRSDSGESYRFLLHGFGYYEETYEYLVSGWRISSTTLTRLHVEHG